MNLGYMANFSDVVLATENFFSMYWDYSPGLEPYSWIKNWG
jgi:hypothetical protein